MPLNKETKPWLFLFIELPTYKLLFISFNIRLLNIYIFIYASNTNGQYLTFNLSAFIYEGLLKNS